MLKWLKKGIIIGAALLMAGWLLGCAALSGGDSTPAPVFTPVPQTVTVPDEPLVLTAPGEVTDGDIYTVFSESFTITAEKPIGSLYLEWDLLPGDWTLIADGKEISCGENGWLHEYVVLDTPAKELVIETPVPMGNVYAFASDAVLPDWVQVWQPAYEHADLLLLPTHADDEHIFFGGMMPYYAMERNLKVQVVYFTHHWDQKHRMHEQLNGLWTAGIRNYPVVGPFDDYMVHSLQEAEAIYSREAAVEFLVEQLRRFQPSVVIGHDLEGEYGHGVHILNAYALTDAVELAGLDAYYPESMERYGSWNTPKLYLHLYPRNELHMDWMVPLESFGGKTAYDVAVEAFDKHVSQQGVFKVYMTYDYYDSQSYGLYRSTVEPDRIGGDVFENITEYY